MSDLVTYHQENNFIDLDFPVFLSESTIVYNKSSCENQLINVFGNIGKTVSAILIEISLFDLFGRFIDKIEYTYEGIIFQSKSYFGDKVLIPIPSETRKVEVNIVKIICESGTVIESMKENTVVLSEQKEIKDYPEEFLAEIEKSNNIKCRYYPKEYENAWQCSCGIANSSERTTCRSCEAKRETVEAICKDEYLDEKYAVYKKQKEIEKEEGKQRKLEEEEKRQKEEEKRKQEEKEQARIRREKTGRIVLIIVCILVVVAICFGIYFGTQNSRQYNKAEKYIEQEQYNEAYEILSGLAESGYKDSNEKLNEIITSGKFGLAELMNSNLNYGDTVFFGNYEQDNDESNGTEPIEWMVISGYDSGCLRLISKYCLDVCTATSNLGAKDWLKNDFINNAFTSEEKTTFNIEAQLPSKGILNRQENNYLENPVAGTAYACRNEKSIIEDCRYWLSSGFDTVQGGKLIKDKNYNYIHKNNEKKTYYVRPMLTVTINQ